MFAVLTVLHNVTQCYIGLVTDVIMFEVEDHWNMMPY